MIDDRRRVQPAEAIRTLVFFGLFFVYVWLWVQTALIHSCGTITNFPVFQTGRAFFREAVPTPGGLVHYVSALLSQLFALSWAGAAVITLHAWALAACTGYFLRAAGLPGHHLLRFVPALLILAAYARYSYHLPLFMGALASIVFACLYVALTSRPVAGQAGWAVAAYLVLGAVLYVIGAAAFLPFAALCVAYELRSRRWGRIGLYAVTAALLPYLLGVLVFRISLPNAYTELLPVSWRVVGWPARERMVATVYAAYLFPILGALVGSVPVRAYLPAVTRREKPIQGRKNEDNASRRRYKLRWVLGSLVLFAAGGAVAVFTPNRSERAMLQVHRYACRRMWPEVLAAASHCPDDRYVMNAVDRALYHTGRLGRDMFLYPQRPDHLLVTGEDQVLWYWHAFDTLIDLGLLNLAEKNLTECVESFGAQPALLERLATVSRAKGRPEVARIWSAARQKAFSFIRHDEDSQAAPATVQPLTKNYVAQFYSQEVLLAALVESGAKNRMAFEYLMAWYMLTGQLGKLVQQVERLAEFGFTEIPPLWQEAILIYAYGTRKPVDLHGLTIHPEMQRRIEHFSSVVNRHGRNRDAAAAELARDYRGSYFLYYFNTILAARR